MEHRFPHLLLAHHLVEFQTQTTLESMKSLCVKAGIGGGEQYNRIVKTVGLEFCPITGKLCELYVIRLTSLSQGSPISKTGIIILSSQACCENYMR